MLVTPRGYSSCRRGRIVCVPGEGCGVGVGSGGEHAWHSRAAAHLLAATAVGRPSTPPTRHLVSLAGTHAHPDTPRALQTAPVDVRAATLDGVLLASASRLAADLRLDAPSHPPAPAARAALAPTPSAASSSLLAAHLWAEVSARAALARALARHLARTAPQHAHTLALLQHCVSRDTLARATQDTTTGAAAGTDDDDDGTAGPEGGAWHIVIAELSGMADEALVRACERTRFACSG